MTFDRVSIPPRPSADAQSGWIVLVPEGMIALNAAVEDTVRTLFGDALVAELTEDEVKAAVAGDHSRTEAWQNAIDRLLGALQSGDLTAFAVQPAQDRRVRLPSSPSPQSSLPSSGLPGRRSPTHQTAGLHRSMVKVCKPDCEGTIARARGNGEDAPITAVPGGTIGSSRPDSDIGHASGASLPIADVQEPGDPDPLPPLLGTKLEVAEGRRPLFCSERSQWEST